MPSIGSEEEARLQKGAGKSRECRPWEDEGQGGSVMCQEGQGEQLRMETTFC